MGEFPEEVGLEHLSILASHSNTIFYWSLPKHNLRGSTAVGRLLTHSSIIQVKRLWLREVK